MRTVNAGTFYAGMGICAFAGLVMGGLCGGAAGFKMGGRSDATEAVGKRASKPMSREEFRDKVMGKTEAEVIKAVGRPNYTADLETSSPEWTYIEVTADPITKKADFSARIRFSGGRVSEVIYR